MPMTEPKLLTDRIDWIVGLDKQPVLRNLLITQCYHDLSSEIARVMGPANLNWCTFATWASKTAGNFIRNQEIPSLFRYALSESSAFRASAARAMERLQGIHGGTELQEHSLLQIAETVAGDVSGQITAGNLKVFSELAPVFAQYVQLFDGGTPDKAGAQRLLESLRVGPSADGGQSLLREAMEHLLAAAREEDPKRRAARMLVANAQTGLHEQIRLQPFIAGSLDAPIADSLGRVWAAHNDSAPEGLWGKIHALWDRLGAAVIREAEDVWSDVATAALMTLAVPGQVLHLGRVLPPPADAPLYPPILQKIDDPDALDLIQQYRAADPKGLGDVGATDWTRLDQRMRYIIALFRSRQCDPQLLQQPFTDTQHAAIVAGDVPDGPL